MSADPNLYRPDIDRFNLPSPQLPSPCTCQTQSYTSYYPGWVFSEGDRGKRFVPRSRERKRVDPPS
ncbi:MAG: hypothetical protein AB4040_12895 [Synechococcus sp.]